MFLILNHSFSLNALIEKHKSWALRSYLSNISAGVSGHILFQGTPVPEFVRSPNSQQLLWGLETCELYNDPMIGCRLLQCQVSKHRVPISRVQDPLAHSSLPQHFYHSFKEKQGIHGA